VQAHATDNERTGFSHNRPRLMRQQNADLRLCSTYDTARPIAFFCECTADDCYAVVWLTAAAFDAGACRPDCGGMTIRGHTGPQGVEPPVLDAATEVVAVPTSPVRPFAGLALDVCDAGGSYRSWRIRKSRRRERTHV
jgi:hypothetical protein